MQPMLSIDFGNSYTKVALRIGRDEPAKLIDDKSLVWDEFNICVPTLAAKFADGGKPRWLYGTEVTRFRADTPGLTVYRNWKPHFFEKADAGAPAKVPASTFACPTAKGRPTPPNVAPSTWAVLVETLPSAELDVLYVKFGGTKEPAEEVTEPEHKAIGAGFFKWLYELIDPVCQLKLKCPAADVPVRVSLPSFGSMTKAELLLADILADAAWRLDRTVPMLPEPLSNAIGTFTEGANATHLGGRQPNYGAMFRDTGMLKRLRDAILHGGPQSAWALIVDVGGYTTDFAMVGIDLQDIDAKLVGELEGRKRLAHRSRALGVSELDRRLLHALPPKKREAVAALLAEPDQQRLEAFHRGCYGPRGHHALKGATIGATAVEKSLIAEAVRQFAEEAADEAEEFLEIHQYERVDDLILTGGGTLIPVVRDALCRRLSGYADQTAGLKVHTYFTEHETLPAVRQPHKMGYEMIRGATALGGASVYFDFADA